MKYELIEQDHGYKKPLIQGTCEQIIEYLKQHDMFSWILDEEPNRELPDLEHITTIDDLERELEKYDYGWWRLTVEKVEQY